MKIYDKVEVKSTGKKGRIVGSEVRPNMEKKWQVRSDDEGYTHWYWDSQIQPR